MKYIRAVLAVVLLVIIDQWTKHLAVLHLMGTDGWTIIPKVFKLYYLENRGSAFGMMQNQKSFFIIFTIVALILITLAYLRIPDQKRLLPLKAAAVMIYAGAIGNFIDRIRQSYVVDFFYFELIDFPIFNVADIYVTISAFLLIFLMLFYYKDDDFDFLMKHERRK
jgi:signal peptidase II